MGRRQKFCPQTITPFDMKTIRSTHLSGFFYAYVAVLLLMAPRFAKAEITGQWNFNDTLTAEIGQDLELSLIHI